MPPAMQKQRATRSRALAAMAVAAGWYLLLCVVGYVRLLHATGGHLIFTQDDPYIHLALANSIAQGHYGINAVEASSPSSSVLWPYLLALFAHTHSLVTVAFGINLLAGLLAALLLGALVACWCWAAAGRDEWLRRGISIVALVFAANLPGLTFLGMEHTLQVLLALGVAWGIVCVLRGEKIHGWCIVAAAMGPLVRYENLGLSLALAIALWGQGRRKAAGGLMAASVAGLLAFSVYLHGLGLPWLPVSVIAKGTLGGGGLGGRLHEAFAPFIQRTPTTPERWLLLVLVLTLCGLAWNEPERRRRFALWGATIAAAGHLVIGRFGWNHRYEVYIVAVSVVVVLHVMHERPRMLLGWYVLGLAACSALYIQAYIEAPLSAQDVYLQQYQMHRFVTEFYSGNVAVGDLGLVSYDRRPGTYVLDLGGLASIEALRQVDRSPAWLDGLAARYQVGLVMVYPEMVAVAPADWTRLGEICNVRPPVALGGACVVYYATPAASLPELRGEFAAFVGTVPAGVRADVGAAQGLHPQ